MTKEQIAITLYGLFDRLWVKSEGVISKEESRALMEAAQFFQLEANVVATVEPSVTKDELVKLLLECETEFEMCEAHWGSDYTDIRTRLKTAAAELQSADEPGDDRDALLREVLAADDANADTATCLPYELTERIRTALKPRDGIKYDVTVCDEFGERPLKDWVNK